MKVPSRPRRYALDKLVTYLSNSIDKLENRLPRAYLAYKTAKTGDFLFSHVIVMLAVYPRTLAKCL